MDAAKLEGAMESVSSEMEDVFQKLGGRELLQGKYPAVYEGLLRGRMEQRGVNDGPDVTANRYDLSNPGFFVKEQKALSADGSNSAKKLYLRGEAIGKFPRGMKYIFASGVLKSDKRGAITSFANEYNAEEAQLLADATCPMQTYFNDIYSLEDVTYWSEGECVAVDHDGNVYTLESKRSQEVLVEGGDSIVEKITVESPIHTNTEKSDKIIVLYARQPGADDKNTWDYAYSDNKEQGGKVKTMLKLKGSIQLKKDFKFLEVNASDCSLDLYFKGLNEPVASYYTKAGGISKCFKISGDGRTIDFEFCEDWHCDLDVSSYNTSCDQWLWANFSFQVYNSLVGERSIDVEIHSSEDPDVPYFESEGSIVYLPLISIRWGCFHKDTRIRMADGSEKKISEITIGDMVLTEDNQAKCVVQTYSSDEKEIVCLETDDGRKLRLTKTHPVFTSQGPVDAENVRVGSELLTADGSKPRVLFAYAIPYNDKVYNLELEESRALIAEGILTADFIQQNETRTKLGDAPLTEKTAETIRQLKALLREIGKVKD